MSFKRSLLIALLCTFSSSALFAATVTQVKGKQALIDLEGDPTEAGEEFFLIDPSTTKKTAIIRIKQVKGNKALCEILKGRAAQGFTLQAKGTGRPMSADVTPEPGVEREERSARSAAGGGRYLNVLKESYGVTGSYNMNSMSANVTYRDPLGTVLKSSVSMSGSGFGVGGFYDYPVGDNIAVRGFAALEQFVVNGSASNNACSGSSSCDANIMYLSMYGLGKYYFLPGQYRTWAGGGLGFMYAVSKSSSALNESNISTNQVLTAAIGTDIQMSRQNYVPVSLEYNMFPDSDSVKASMIVIKAGWAWNL